jgi:ATP-dependent DNA ligase
MNQFDAAALDHVLEACEAHGVEGVVLKRRDSTYRPGERCDTWRKAKCPNWRRHAERRKIGPHA